MACGTLWGQWKDEICDIVNVAISPNSWHCWVSKGKISSCWRWYCYLHSIFPKKFMQKNTKKVHRASLASWNYEIADVFDVVDIVQIVEKPLQSKKEEKWAEWHFGHFGGSSSPVWILSCAPTTNLWTSVELILEHCNWWTSVELIIEHW